jgi:hypothetical protein
VQCSRFARALLRQSPLTQWLGGQHGEEEKSEGGEEDWREEAPEEEVANRPFTTIFGVA